MKIKTILLDFDQTLSISVKGIQTLHPRWREIMCHDVTLWTSCDYGQLIAGLLDIGYISKDEPRDDKPKADVLIDDCAAFQRDCEVKEYYKSIDDFLNLH